MTIHIGTSGWSYEHWQGVLYPQGVRPSERLSYYGRQYQTVEINSTFYHWPPATTFTGWRERTPPGFSISVKAPRGLTHRARLYKPERWLERVLGGLNSLADKRGILLLQLPPDLPHDQARLDYFLRQIPGWARIAVEFRHPSWHREEVFGLLERHGAAYCVMSGANLPCRLRATASFVYVRMHGPDRDHLYAGSYSDADLHWWAQRIREWAAAQREVFVYFNNDGFGHAVRNATSLQAILSP